MLASGVDPVAQRKEDKAAVRTSIEGSFQTIANLWLAHWCEGKSLGHADSVERRMKADILPALGPHPISYFLRIYEVSCPIAFRWRWPIAKHQPNNLQPTANTESAKNSGHYAIAC